MPPRYSEDAARAAIAASHSYAETLRRLEMCPSGGAHVVLRKWAELWGISTSHFDPYAASRGRNTRVVRLPLEQILVEGSTYCRGKLKPRLYEEGLKERRCELCGQDELWRGRRMSLILDHINGVRDDNRIENLRIVCPNCAATLDTHCNRGGGLEPRRCRRCDAEFRPKYSSQRYCSAECGRRHDRSYLRVARPASRKVQRPTLEQLQADLATMSYLAVGRKYGVSDNAVRKWLRWYEREVSSEAA
jgi:HNH endonuclease